MKQFLASIIRIDAGSLVHLLRRCLPTLSTHQVVLFVYACYLLFTKNALQIHIFNPPVASGLVRCGKAKDSHHKNHKRRARTWQQAHSESSTAWKKRQKQQFMHKEELGC